MCVRVCAEIRPSSFTSSKQSRWCIFWQCISLILCMAVLVHSPSPLPLPLGLLCYMLLLSGRSPSKILFTRDSGRVFQLDLLPLYGDKGSVERIEVVPYRLTRNLATFFTAFGVEVSHRHWGGGAAVGWTLQESLLLCTGRAKFKNTSLISCKGGEGEGKALLGSGWDGKAPEFALGQVLAHSMLVWGTQVQWELHRCLHVYMCVLLVVS